MVQKGALFPVSCGFKITSIFQGSPIFKISEVQKIQCSLFLSAKAVLPCVCVEESATDCGCERFFIFFCKRLRRVHLFNQKQLPAVCNGLSPFSKRGLCNALRINFRVINVLEMRI